MMGRFRTIIGIAVISTMVFGCQQAAKTTTGTEQPAAANPAAGAAEGEVFPDFEFQTLDGGTASLAAYRGKIIILDLFATWCPPCRMTIPHLVSLQQEHPENVAVIGLSYDQGAADQVKQFAAKMKINYPVYWGSEALAQHVGLRGIPHMLVLDQNGRLVRSYVGYRDKEVFDKDIQTLSGK